MRTIIDLPEEQIKSLAVLCESEGISRAEAIRRAVAEMIEKTKKKPSSDKALNDFFGIWKDRKDIGDSVEYIRKMRAEWDREWDE